MIEFLLAGRSAAAVFPTGSGKSLCYQLPSTLLDGLTIVVSPLIALMKDQIDALTARGVAAARLDSSLEREEFQEALEGLRSGRTRLLYASPERFNNERFRDFVLRQPIALFAVDEAHCISEWGHNFRPDYLKLAQFAREAGAERILALTATATPEVLAEMCEHFRIDPECVVSTGFYRPNLELRARAVTDSERDACLLEELHRAPSGPKIVYVTVQKSAMVVADRLRQEGFDARPYHAGLDAAVRHETQEWFLAASDGIVVATIAFGMGIDKPNIRGVFHYNAAKSIENYSQEIGRAGRDGQPAVCASLIAARDQTVLANFAHGDTPSHEAIVRFVEWVFSQPVEFELNSFELSAHADIRPLVLKTLLVYLELDGLLEGGTPFYSSYRFIPQRPSAEILADIADPQERAFTKRVLAQSQQARKWFTIDIASTCEKVGAAREDVVRVLDLLGERGDLELEASGLRQRYCRAGSAPNLEALAEDLHQRSLEREERELERIRDLEALLLHSDCMSGALAGYFGEELPSPCGNCSACRGEERGEIVPVTDELTTVPNLDDLVAEHPRALGDARARARLLCGLTSPALTREKLTRHRHFGALADRPFEQVLAHVE